MAFGSVDYRDPTPITPTEPGYTEDMVPPDILNYTNQTRNKMWGVDVRETVARAGEIAGIISQTALDLVEENAQRQTELEQKFDEQIQGSTVDGELIAARTNASGQSWATVGARMNAQDTTVQDIQTQVTALGTLRGTIIISNINSTENLNKYITPGKYAIYVGARDSIPATANIPNIPNFYGLLNIWTSTGGTSGTTGAQNVLVQQLVGYQTVIPGNNVIFTCERRSSSLSGASWYDWDCKKIVSSVSEPTSSQWLDQPTGTIVLIG